LQKTAELIEVMFRAGICGGSRNHVFWYCRRKGQFWGSCLSMTRLACSRCSQPYSLGGSSDAAFGYQSTSCTVATCFNLNCPIFTTNVFRLCVLTVWRVVFVTAYSDWFVSLTHFPARPLTTSSSTCCWPRRPDPRDSEPLRLTNTSQLYVVSHW